MYLVKKLSLIAYVLLFAALFFMTLPDSVEAKSRQLGRWTVHSKMPAGGNYSDYYKQVSPSKVYSYSTQPYQIQNNVRYNNFRCRNRAQYRNRGNSGYYPVSYVNSGYPAQNQRYNKKRQNKYFNRSNANPYFRR